MPRLKRFLSEVKKGMVPQTLWKHEDVGNTQEAKKELLATTSFARSEDVLNTVKPTRLIQRIIEISTDIERSNIIVDFFAGGGSTAHAAMNYNRNKNGSVKYLLVEMGEHFKTIILPRIKKIAFHSKWKDGKPNFAKGESGMSHFVKYYDLEQYEESLQRARYADADLFDDPNQDPYHAYVFLRDLKMLDSLEIDHPNQTVHFHPERIYPDEAAAFGTSIDLAESLSHLRGKWIKRITASQVEFQDGEKLSLSDPDWRWFKPMIWWG
jgi:adenine-specific DNA-methyltransferase